MDLGNLTAVGDREARRLEVMVATVGAPPPRYTFKVLKDYDLGGVDCL
jgi:hypothetical protein